MKCIIAGSRSIHDSAAIAEAIEASGLGITTVLSGGCRGVDQLSEAWACTNNIPFEQYPADWSKHGHAAGPIRNQRMVDCADALIAIWDGKSSGTRDIIRRARNAGLQVYVRILLPKQNEVPV